MYLAFTFILTFLINALFVDTPLNSQFYTPQIGSARGLEVSGYKITPRDRFKDTWLMENIPSNAPLAADNLLAPHLVNREILYLTRHPSKNPPKTLSQLLPQVEYVVVDALFDFVVGNAEQVSVGGVNYELDAISLLLQDPTFNLLKAEDGLLLFGREQIGLAQQVETELTTQTPRIQARFGDAIGLVNAQIEPLGGNRFRLHFDWFPLRSLEVDPPLFAVSELVGVPHGRIIHLPTRALYPTPSWRQDHLVHESFEIVLPEDIPVGSYPLQVGWYNSNSVFAPVTNEHSRIGDQVQVGLI
ncbi:MAG: DUF2079 domain-containing protein, partial [Phycisphaerae bacterium]|nr:DUF2079 domain-containing protein [Phycisphaerae bacterium]